MITKIFYVFFVVSLFVLPFIITRVRKRMLKKNFTDIEKIIYGDKYDVINLNGEKYVKINKNNFQKLDTHEVYGEEEMINKFLDNYNEKIKKYENVG